MTDQPYIWDYSCLLYIRIHFSYSPITVNELNLIELSKKQQKINDENLRIPVRAFFTVWNGKKIAHSIVPLTFKVSAKIFSEDWFSNGIEKQR